MAKLKNIEWRNIYYMLCYCVDELKYFNEGLIKQEEIKGTHDLLAQLLINSFELLYRNGYIKKYKEETIATSKPHGRIDIPKSISTGACAKGRIVCHIDTLDSNNRINQIIKAAFNVLILSNSKIDERIDNKLLAKLYNYRELLKHVDNLDISHQILAQKMDIPEWYKPIFAVCKMILYNWIALDESGSIRLLELNDEEVLWRIWEKYLRSFIKKNYPEYIVEKRTLYFSNGDRVTPDIVIIDEINYKLLVADAKWYENEKVVGHNMAELGENCAAVQNTINLGNKYKVTGINIYASTYKAEIRPPRILDAYNILRADTFVSVNTSMKELEEQIHWIVQRGFNLVDSKETEYM